MTGPAYARALADAAVAAGAEVRLGTTVTCCAPGAAGGFGVTMTSARGIETVGAGVVLLATGCRERPRTARLIPGDRPAGVMTTGELQQRVYLGGERLPGRALVVGAEHVSFSAVVTLAHAGARVVALVTEYERQQSYAAFRAGAALRWRVPVWTSTAVRRVDGRERLAGVEVADLRTGASRFVPCDTLVFTADWIPDHELARHAGLDLDPGTRGPTVDTLLRTSAAGVFAAGGSPRATWCTRPRRRTSPRCRGGTPRGRSPRPWVRRGLPRPRCRCGPSRRCGGFRRTPSLSRWAAAPSLHRWAGSCCAAQEFRRLAPAGGPAGWPGSSAGPGRCG